MTPVYRSGMHFAKQDYDSPLLVRAYEDGQVTVGAQSYRSSIILSRAGIVDWRPQHHLELTTEDLYPLRDLRPEIVLLGTGSALHFPSPSLTAVLLEAGIGVEVMGTAAACRTFNVLLGEDRDVVMALMLR